MHDLLPVLLKALNGGIIVVVFALVGATAQPKRFAGLFGAAPTAALANLGVLVVTTGASSMPTYATGMLIGCVAFLAYALVCPVLIKRLGALRGTTASFAAWFGVAGPLYLVVQR